jgi:hypothetical protein
MPRARPRRIDHPIALHAKRGSGAVIKLGEVVMLLDLHRQGLTVSAIARELGIDRKTVGKCRLLSRLSATSNTTAPTGHLQVTMTNSTRRQDLTALPYTVRLAACVDPLFPRRAGRHSAAISTTC